MGHQDDQLCAYIFTHTDCNPQVCELPSQQFTELRTLAYGKCKNSK